MSKKPVEFLTRYGPWALVTGGSEGLGSEFAEQLARRGLNLVLAARRREALEGFARNLKSRHSVRIRTISLDLSNRASVGALTSQVKDLEIGLLVCNAASAPIGPFLEHSPETHQRLVDLNCLSPALLSHELGRGMAARGRGGVIFVSSMAGFQGGELVSHYGASKAYLRVLAEGLWVELGRQGVDVLACCPGIIRTPTYLKENPASPGRFAPPRMECGPVVSQTLHALGRGPVVVPGAANRAAVWITQRLLPRRAAIALTSRGTRAMYPGR